MKELMLYVEQIVRPVRATQARKLQMRTDLLAHLEAALEEERERFPGDESVALEQAMHRLGDPAELTRQLQRTVPAFEAVLLSRFSTTPRFRGKYQRMERGLGQEGVMVWGHSMILSAIAIVAAVPFLLFFHDILVTNQMQATYEIPARAGVVIGWSVLLVSCFRFTFYLANPIHLFKWEKALKRGALVLSLHVCLIFFLAFNVANRWPTPGELSTYGASSLALLALSAIIARHIGILRRPYDDWLNLDLAG